MQKRIALTIALVALSTTGCATYKLADGPIEQAYVVANDYNQAQLTALNVLADPVVPKAAKDAIKKADAVGNPAIHALAEAAKQYQTIKAEIDAVKAAGNQPTETQIAAGQQALATLKASILKCQPLVEQLIAAIRGIAK